MSLGLLDFTDLLGRLRDLLGGDLAARRALQQRFRYLLVDEFQDTDPLQAEIVFLLCEREPLAADWRDVVLTPGKLFVVGDPKQSIYRFRRADISLYDQVKSAGGWPAGGRRGSSPRSARTSAPPRPRSAWVNNVFADVFDSDEAEGRQPGYQWVEPYRPAGRRAARRGAARPRVWLAGRRGRSRAPRRGSCAGGPAARMHGPDAARWSVQDRDAAGDDGALARPPRWGDVALLFRATTGLETYEQALRVAGVPYRVDGGKALLRAP